MGASTFGEYIIEEPPAELQKTWDAPSKDGVAGTLTVWNTAED